MNTTWVNDYSQLDAFIEHIQSFAPGTRK